MESLRARPTLKTPVLYIQRNTDGHSPSSAHSISHSARTRSFCSLSLSWDGIQNHQTHVMVPWDALVSRQPWGTVVQEGVTGGQIPSSGCGGMRTGSPASCNRNDMAPLDDCWAREFWTGAWQIHWFLKLSHDSICGQQTGAENW